MIVLQFLQFSCLLRSDHSVSHQPLPLRPPSPHPQPNATILYVSFAPSHALLQPVAAAPPSPAANHPPLLSHATSCQTPGPSLQPPAASAPPLPSICTPLSVTGTQPQPLPMRHLLLGVCRGKIDFFNSSAEPELDPAQMSS